MQDIEYNGKKALLFDTKDICEINTRTKFGMQLNQKIEVLRAYDYEYILLLSDIPERAIPIVLREILNQVKRCYIGSI